MIKTPSKKTKLKLKQIKIQTDSYEEMDNKPEEDDIYSVIGNSCHRYSWRK